MSKKFIANKEKEEILKKNKYLLITFFSFIFLMFIVNIIAYLNDVWGTEVGKYLKYFNIFMIVVTYIQFRILNKPFKNK